MRWIFLALVIALLAVYGGSSAELSAAPVPTATAVPTESPAAEPLAGHALGPDDATLTIVMYGDFQCVLCARYAHDLEVVRSSYPNDVRLVWRHLPDSRNHDKAELTLLASEAAAAQGQFWPMHDQLFTHQETWTALAPGDFRAVLRDYAAAIGLDVARFEAELDAGTYLPVIDASREDAARLNIVGVPVLLFNGVPFSGRDDRFGLEEAVRLALLKPRQFESAPSITLDPAKTYRAVLVTEYGDVTVNLFAEAAPVTVNNFVFLARAGWYDNITFHYVLPDLVAQTGDPSDTGRGLPGYTIPGETGNGLAFDRPGLVAMAHPSGLPDGAGSVFFITLAAVPEWTGEYTIFGEVVSGLEVLDNLTPRNANDPVEYPDPPPGDWLITVRIEETVTP